MVYYVNLNLQLGRNINSPLKAYFTFPTFIILNLKSKKNKMALWSEHLFESDLCIRYGYTPVLYCIIAPKFIKKKPSEGRFVFWSTSYSRIYAEIPPQCNTNIFCLECSFWSYFKSSNETKVNVSASCFLNFETNSNRIQSLYYFGVSMTGQLTIVFDEGRWEYDWFFNVRVENNEIKVVFINHH